jgi:UDPglucose 6-dehydrogenase
VLSAVDNVNNRQRQMVARKVQTFFESAGGVSGRVLAVWGLSFKANTDDIRHSPAIDIVNELSRAGMQIRAFDPAAGQNAKQMFANSDNVSVGDKQYEILDGADALAVLTDWHQFRTPDFPGIEKRLKQPVIFDARNLYSTDLIVRHNFTCIRTGRPDIIAGPPID